MCSGESTVTISDFSCRAPLESRRARAAAQDPQAAPVRPPPDPLRAGRRCRSPSVSSPSVASEIPSLDPARLQQQEVDGYIYDRKGKRVLAVLRGKQSRILVGLERQIAPLMKLAIVAIEDKRFYEHRGVDVHGIMRAFWQDVRHKQVVEGGSTITQQFVKNTYTKNQRSIGRKLKEAALAWQLEQRWSKDRILTAYLNTIYFGNGAYGVAAGGADVLPPRRRASSTLGRGGAARRDPERPVALRPGDEPEGRPRAAEPRAEGDARPGRHHRSRVRRTRPQRQAAEPGGRAPLRRARARRRTSPTTSSSS